MLILVIGRTGSGKTFFTEHQLHPYVSGRKVKVISEPTPSLLKASPAVSDDEVLVVEAVSDKDVPHDMRLTAEYIVFMTDTAMQEYFDRGANDVTDIRNKRVYSVVKAICGIDFTPVVFDPNGKRFIIHYA